MQSPTNNIKTFVDHFCCHCAFVQHILLLDDMTGLLPPCLLALRLVSWGHTHFDSPIALRLWRFPWIQSISCSHQSHGWERDFAQVPTLNAMLCPFEWSWTVKWINEMTCSTIIKQDMIAEFQFCKSIWNSPEMCPSWRQFREQSTTSLSSLMPPWLPWWKPTFSHQKLRLLDYQMHAFQAAFRLGWWLSAWGLSTLQAFCSWLGATGSRRWSRICGSWRIEDMRRLGRSDFVSLM